MGLTRLGGGSSGPTTEIIYTAVKTADTTRNNTNTTADDPHLTVTVPAGTYAIVGWVHYTSSTTADLQIGWTLPAGSTLYWSPNAPASNATSGLSINIQRYGAQNVPMGGIGATAVTAQPHGVLTVTNAGAVTLKWAQNTAEVSDSIMVAGSWIRLTKVA